MKLFFLRFLILAVKLDHFTIFDFFLYLINIQAYQQKTEKFFVSEEKKFHRIGYTELIFPTLIVPRNCQLMLSSKYLLRSTF